MSNIYGLGLANASNAADLERIDALGCDWFLALQDQLADLAALLQRRPGTRGILRWHGRDLLSRPAVDVAREVAEVWPRARAAGIIDLIVGNEYNNPIEGRVYLPTETAARLATLLRAVRGVCPDARLHLPAFSPPLDGALYYLACRDAGVHELVDVVDAHCYGDSYDALNWLDIVLGMFPGMACTVTEYNYGAGRAVNPDWYAIDALAFFAGVEARDRVESACFFIWHWENPDSQLQTTVDVRGQPIEAAIRTARKADRRSTMLPEVAKLSPNRGDETGLSAKRRETIGIVIHSTRGPTATLETDYRATVRFFSQAASEVSAHAVIGPSEITLCVPWDQIAWHAREANLTHIGIELAQPASQPPFADAQYLALAAMVGKLCDRYGIPRRRVPSQYLPGLIGHEDAETGRRESKSDPGWQFDWQRFLRLLNGDSDSGGHDMDGAMRTRALAHLDILWGTANTTRQHAQQLREDAAEQIAVAAALEQAADHEQERIIALKRDLGLN